MDAAEDDAGEADAEGVDASASDASELDTGETDASGESDSGPVGFGSIVLLPPDELSLGPSPSQGTIMVSNVGTGALRITELALLGADGTTSHPSVDDFAIRGCSQLPCDPMLLLCAPGPGCAGAEATIVIDYVNNDISTIDLAELYVRSDDPGDPEHIIVLSAQDSTCLLPTAVITVVTANPTVGVPIDLDASSSLPGPPGAALAGYAWSFLFAPGPFPTLSTPSDITTSFTPQSAGTYVVALHVTNDCGATSSTPAQEVINL